MHTHGGIIVNAVCCALWVHCVLPPMRDIVLWLCSQRDMQQLKSILCMPSLNPDIRRAAAEQLLSLASDPRFTPALSDPSLLHAIHEALASTCQAHCLWRAGLVEDEDGNGSHAHPATLEIQRDMPNMQLPIACLDLLGGIARYCPEAKSLLLQEADR